MRHRAREVAITAVPGVRAVSPVRAVALALAAGAAVAGCATATASPGAPAATAASRPAATRPAATQTAASLYGPPGPDPACVAAKQAELTLSSRQGKDQDNESALDKDFTNFANALSAAAGREKHAATAQAMYALATDYTDLVESQSGVAQLPDMSQVQKDGTTFDKACTP